MAETEYDDTPLSDLTEVHANARDDRSYKHFLDCFCIASVGVRATGAPTDVSGAFTSSSEHPVSVGLSTDSEGRSLILAFADPLAFSRNFGTPFNAEMTGNTLFKAVLHNMKCEGIRVNSAKAEISMFISRTSAVEKLGVASPPTATKNKPWWKRWKTRSV